MILSRRANDDDHRDGFTKWPFMTTHSWGEYPHGVWKLEVGKQAQIMHMYMYEINFQFSPRPGSIQRSLVRVG